MKWAVLAGYTTQNNGLHAATGDSCSLHGMHNVLLVKPLFFKDTVKTRIQEHVD